MKTLFSTTNIQHASHTLTHTRKQISMDRMVCFNDEHVCFDMESLANPKTNCSHSRFSKEEILFIYLNICAEFNMWISNEMWISIKRIQNEWVGKKIKTKGRLRKKAPQTWNSILTDYNGFASLLGISESVCVSTVYVCICILKLFHNTSTCAS